MASGGSGPSLSRLHFSTAGRVRELMNFPYHLRTLRANVITPDALSPFSQAFAI